MSQQWLNVYRRQGDYQCHLCLSQSTDCNPFQMSVKCIRRRQPGVDCFCHQTQCRPRAHTNSVIYHASCRHDRRTSQPLCLVLASIVRYVHAAQNQAMVLYWKNGLSRLQKRHPFIFFPLEASAFFPVYVGSGSD